MSNVSVATCEIRDLLASWRDARGRLREERARLDRGRDRIDALGPDEYTAEHEAHKSLDSRIIRAERHLIDALFREFGRVPVRVGGTILAIALDADDADVDIEELRLAVIDDADIRTIA